jgi:hypothetical protein
LRGEFQPPMSLPAKLLSLLILRSAERASRRMQAPLVASPFETAAEFIIGPRYARTRWQPPQGEERDRRIALLGTVSGDTCARSRDTIRSELFKFVVPLSDRGRRESRALTAPVDPVRWSTRASRVPKHAGKAYRYSRDIPAFPTQWLYGFLRALPGERRFFVTVAKPAQADRIDATVAAPGPHDFAVRCSDFARQTNCLTPQRPSQPAPRSVTIARTPLLVARAERTSASDLPDGTSNCFRFSGHNFVKTE